MYSRGGAIYGYRLTVSLTQSTLHNNTAAQCGAVRATRIEIIECVVTGNTATGVDERDGGGALCLWDGHAIINASTFADNTALENGGVIEADRSNISLYTEHFHQQCSTQKWWCY